MMNRRDFLALAGAAAIAPAVAKEMSIVDCVADMCSNAGLVIDKASFAKANAICLQTVRFHPRGFSTVWPPIPFDIVTTATEADALAMGYLNFVLGAPQ
jgi:hypothetical protein